MCSFSLIRYRNCKLPMLFMKIAFNGNQFSSMTSVPVTAAANDFYEKFKGVEFMGYKHLSKKWRADIGFALGDQSCKIIKHSFGLLYKDECAEFKLSVERSDYRAGDLKPDTSKNSLFT